MNRAYSGLKTCYNCGKSFVVPSLGCWLPKLQARIDDHERTLYFCKNGCKEQWLKNRFKEEAE